MDTATQGQRLEVRSERERWRETRGVEGRETGVEGRETGVQGRETGVEGRETGGVEGREMGRVEGREMGGWTKMGRLLLAQLPYCFNTIHDFMS